SVYAADRWKRALACAVRLRIFDGDSYHCGRARSHVGSAVADTRRSGDCRRSVGPCPGRMGTLSDSTSLKENALTEQNPPVLVTIAIIGGTGKEGSGLAKRWVNSGYRVIIGSRDAERAQQKVDELNAEMGGSFLHGMENIEAAKQADLVV